LVVKGVRFVRSGDASYPPRPLGLGYVYRCSLPLFLLLAPIFSFLCFVLRFGRIDSPISFCLFFIIACFSDTETSRQTGGPAFGMSLLGRTVQGRKPCGVFIYCLVYHRCVRVITLYGVEGVSGFECSFPPCVLAWWMQFRSWRSILLAWGLRFDSWWGRYLVGIYRVVLWLATLRCVLCGM
jgi:hypothetical protein